jgi:hypothetical protein
MPKNLNNTDDNLTSYERIPQEVIKEENDTSVIDYNTQLEKRSAKELQTIKEK